MTPTAYPWAWLAEAVAPAFAVRYPWVERVRRAGASAEAVCLLVPAAAGPLAGWAGWVVEELADDRPVDAPAGDPPAVAAALAQLTGLDPPAAEPGWADRLLVAARREVPHVTPTPLVVGGPGGSALGMLDDLLRAQRAIGYPLARPVVVARTRPPGWGGEVVRFGLPEPAGCLHRIDPAPARDVPFWTGAVLALVAAWEAGAVPARADELHDQLTRTRIKTARDPGFDDWLDGRLDKFAAAVDWADAPPVPPDLAFGPAADGAVDDGLWQAGAVGWAGGWFDLTPVRARGWARTADPAARAGVTRRRLVNAPLARWLAAWAASVEEALRVLGLRQGVGKLRDHLGRAGPRRAGGGAASRLDELGRPTPDEVLRAADFGDLAGFAAAAVGRGPAAGSFAVLDRCRRARNRVVHERTATAADLFDIAAAVELLHADGLI